MQASLSYCRHFYSGVGKELSKRHILKRGTSAISPSRDLSLQVSRASWLSLMPFYPRMLKMELFGGKWMWAYSFWAIHVFIASPTARERSPFFPPNLSTVFNLSCFSSSSGRSTLIRPIFITYFFRGFPRFSRGRWCSNKRTARSPMLFLFLLLFYIHFSSLMNISYYMLTLL